MPPKVLCITGPTATGKTRLGVELALAHGGEVVSVDSMQVYRGMNIGTAKPTKDEMRGIPHHMLDMADPSENYSVANYVAQATSRVDDILARGKLPIFVGGTGLYLDSLLARRHFADFHPDSTVRADLQLRAEREGMDPLFSELQALDPDSASRLHPNDQKRVIRALEVYHTTGKTITTHNAETKHAPPRYAPLMIGLNFSNRDHLRAQIDRRVDEMLASGLIDEVRGLLAQGLSHRCTAMQAIGYKELAAALLGKCSISQAIEQIKLRSRQYAKRQLTWLRRNSLIHWFLWGEAPDFCAAQQFATNCLEEFGLL